MPNEIIGTIGLLIAIVLMFLKVPLGVTFSLIGGIGTIFLIGFDGAMSRFASVPYNWTTEYALTALPMFVLMGFIISETDITKDLYSTARKWIGHLPGGLAMTTLLVTALFGAVSGAAVAAATTVGLTCYPEMKRHGYSPALSSGVIASGSTMAIMIPPSNPMIIYCIVAQVSIGKMFLAGIGPGIAEVIVFFLFIYIMVKRNPSLAPVSIDNTTFMEKLKGSKNVMPIVTIFMLVFGGMYAGVFTPTEAGAAGVAITTLVCLAMGRLSGQGLIKSLNQTLRLTGIIFFLLVGVMLFNSFMALCGLSTRLGELVIGMDVSPTIFLAFILFLYLILGALMDELSMLLLTLPFFLPTLGVLGIDTIWFGILVILAWQLGGICPPVGLIAFVTNSVLPEVPIETVYKGCLPFVAALILIELLVLFFPDVAMLPLSFMK